MLERILLVEDDATFAKWVATLLQSERYRIRVAQDADDALLRATTEQPDLILIDVILDGTNGLALCQRLKADPRTARIPIILMSGQRLDEDDQLAGLCQGADDYLLKPVSGKMLLGKIRTVLRRYDVDRELTDVLTAEDLTLDVSSWKVMVRDKPIALTRKEFDLLVTLLRKRGRVLRPSYLLETIWGYDSMAYDDTRTVKVHISSLRNKLGHKLAEKIVNVPGVGYRFEE
jgi:DNA-binding response OmpR family regulator